MLGGAAKMGGVFPRICVEHGPKKGGTFLGKLKQDTDIAITILCRN